MIAGLRMEDSRPTRYCEEIPMPVDMLHVVIAALFLIVWAVVSQIAFGHGDRVEEKSREAPQRSPLAPSSRR
jgi:hypothetical protein